MGMYGNMSDARALAGMIAEETQSAYKVVSRVAQNTINFGDPVMGYIGEENKCWKHLVDTSKVVLSADLVTSNTITITVKDVALTPIVFSTNHLTTMNAIVAALKGTVVKDAEEEDVLLDAVLDATDGTNRTLLIRGKGAILNDDVTFVVTNGASQATATKTYYSDQVLLGGAVFTHRNVSLQDNDAGYKRFDMVNVAEQGVFWMIVSGVNEMYEAVTLSSAGVFTSNTGSATNAQYQSNNATGAFSETLAKIQFSKPNKLTAVVAWA